MRIKHLWFFWLSVLFLAVGCSSNPAVSLMPTPVVYTELGIGPLDAIPPANVGRRDMTAMVFAWPTHQNILAYGAGIDLARGYRSAESLADLLDLLARHSDAGKIHIVSWSAGGRVVTRARTRLSERYPDLSSDDLARRLRIGTVYYAASDIPRAEFIKELDTLDRLADRIIVTVTDNDGALKSARRFMGGGYRLGDRRGNLSAGQFEQLMKAESLEVIDVSMGARERGFDISGHLYWLDHPWASNDLLLAIRSDLAPQESGLVQSDLPFFWFIPPDYPQRLRRSMLRPDLKMRE